MGLIYIACILNAILKLCRTNSSMAFNQKLTFTKTTKSDVLSNTVTLFNIQPNETKSDRIPYQLLHIQDVSF